MTVHTSQVDGVPVFWTGGPHPFTASLLFRVGVRDESFTTAGITHLIEHLAMSGATRRTWDTEAHVGMTFTEFTSAGPAREVVEFLGLVCRALTDLPLDRLAVEKKILEAEDSSAVRITVADQLRHRFGLSGLGLAGVKPPVLGRLSEVDLTGHAQSYFTRANAALVLSGPPPRDLRLPLPSGAPRPVPLDVPRSAGAATWFGVGDDEIGLSFLVDDSTPLARAATDATCRIAYERMLDDLRERRGWMYSVDFKAFRSRDGSATVCFWADPPEPHANDVRRGMTRILRELRDLGPSNEELSEDREAQANLLTDPNGVFPEAEDAARAHLMAEPHTSFADERRLHHLLNVANFRSVLSRLDTTLIIGMPYDVTPDGPDLLAATLSTSATPTGTSFGRSAIGLLNGVPRRARLVVGRDAVFRVDPDETLRVRWDEVVGAEHDDKAGVLTLYSSDGTDLTLSAGWFRNGARAMAEISQRIDPAVRFRAEPDTRSR